MPALTVLWILFLLVTIYDNQTELLLQTKLQLQVKEEKKKKAFLGNCTGKGYPSDTDWVLGGRSGALGGGERIVPPKFRDSI